MKNHLKKNNVFFSAAVVKWTLILSIFLLLVVLVYFRWFNYYFGEQIPQTSQSSKTSSQMLTDRGRVRIIENTVVSDNEVPLRGESLHLAGPKDIDYPLMSHLYNLSIWQKLRDDFNLNTVRLFIYRPPQNWDGGPGEKCSPPIYRCYDFNFMLNDPHTVLDVIDDVVNIASVMGMYLILDYHPVGGIDEADATRWWTKIAPRYKNRTHVIYELANEPIAWSAASYGEKAIRFQEQLYTLIRSLAPDTHIILWSFANARGPMLEKVRQAKGISYVNASVAFHTYGYEKETVKSLRNHYPVINTEIGADESRFEKTAEMEKMGISWVWLGGTKIPTVSSNGFSPDDTYWPPDLATD